MMRSQSSSLSTLPSDLLEEILSRVPATSFKQVRSTCKQWYALFNDHRFIRKHSDKAAKQYLVLLMTDSRFSLLSVDLRGLHDNVDPSIELEDEVSLTDLHYSIGKFSDFDVFHCDGLLLCTTTTTRFVVFNPCTGQTSWFRLKYFNQYKFALGYKRNKSGRDYKIFRFLDSVYTNFEMKIYQFNSKSWRVLDSIIPDFLLQSRVGVSLKGNTYWIASDKQDEVSGNEFLMMFDFTTERFGERLPLPHKGFGHRDFKTLSSVRDERLAVLFEDKDTSTMEIWITNNIPETKAMSWSNFLKIGLNIIQFQFLNNRSFFIDEENKVAVCFDSIRGEEESSYKDVLYIVGENGRWRKVNLRDGVYYWTNMYVPSLAQI